MGFFDFLRRTKKSEPGDNDLIELVRLAEDMGAMVRDRYQEDVRTFGASPALDGEMSAYVLGAASAVVSWCEKFKQGIPASAPRNIASLATSHCLETPIDTIANPESLVERALLWIRVLSGGDREQLSHDYQADLVMSLGGMSFLNEATEETRSEFLNRAVETCVRAESGPQIRLAMRKPPPNEENRYPEPFRLGQNMADQLIAQFLDEGSPHPWPSSYADLWAFVDDIAPGAVNDIGIMMAKKAGSAIQVHEDVVAAIEQGFRSRFASTVIRSIS